MAPTAVLEAVTCPVLIIQVGHLFSQFGDDSNLRRVGIQVQTQIIPRKHLSSNSSTHSQMWRALYECTRSIRRSAT